MPSHATDANSRCEQFRSRHEPLTVCPVDGYLLRGLPAAHRCPECGFPFDPSTRVWTAGRWGLFQGASMALLACLAAGFVARFTISGPDEPAVVVLGFTMLGWAGYVLHGFLLFRGKPFVATTPDGLVLRLHDSQVRIIRSDQVAAVEVTGTEDRAFCRLRLTDRPESIDLSSLIRSPLDADDLREAIARLQATGGGFGICPSERAPSEFATPSW